MRTLLENLGQLPRADKWLLASIPIILLVIVLVLLYGLRQSEITEHQEQLFKQETAIATERAEAAIERNRIELERQAAEAALEILKLKQQAAELSANQAQSNVRDIRQTLSFVNQERLREQKEHDKKLQTLIITNVEACKRWLAECARAKQLRLRAADAPCECR